jgi:hypothetical protein
MRKDATAVKSSHIHANGLDEPEEEEPKPNRRGKPDNK